MTISEMHTAFKMELDKSSSLELPSFEPEEIDYWLNRGIRQFVKNRFTGTEKGVAFEGNTKRIEDIKSLIVETTINGASLVAGTRKVPSYVASLASITTGANAKWFILGEEVDIVYTKLGDTTTTTKTQGVTQCTVDTYRSHVDDPYSEHRLHYEEAKPLRLVYQDYIELITDGNYTINAYRIRYLRKPATVDVDSAPAVSCDLPEHTHDEIVVLAANLALENIEQQRYKTNLEVLNKVE